jgi:phospholipase C
MKLGRTERRTTGAAAAVIVCAGVLLAGIIGYRSVHASAGPASVADSAATATPIKQLVVIYQENRSFDHYFGTYPVATNPKGEPPFFAAPDTPSVNGLSGPLLTNNPNGANPVRLDRSQAVTCKPSARYTKQQMAFDNGLMDRFPSSLGEGCAPRPDTVLDYFDGNTVTGLWNYAQRFALSDNFYGTNFGHSTPGHLNLVSGNTFGAICGPPSSVYNVKPCPPGQGQSTPGHEEPPGDGTLFADSDPTHDVCSKNGIAGGTTSFGGTNIGDLLNAKGATWGWFQGGFASPGYIPGKPNTDDPAKLCTGSHKNIAGATVLDYLPHHEPFQYYSATSNPKHLPPLSISAIGHQDQANHQYDIRDFWAAADAGNMPSVSFLKAPAYQDGHAGATYSNPLDEQHFLVDSLNHLQRLPQWRSTAVLIAYDDSGGWYDHQMGPITRQSQTNLDALTGTNQCGDNPARVPKDDQGNPEQARCGYGPRLPMLALSPYAKRNFVDHSFTDQSSITRFIEDNWLGAERLGNGSTDAQAGLLSNMFDFRRANPKTLRLDPITGERVGG